MTFAEKLQFLIPKGKQAEIARLAGISPTLLSAYMLRGSEPGAMAAFKIARVLRVPLEWLLDDSLTIPAPIRDELPIQKLQSELGQRMELSAVSLLLARNEALQVDWVAVTEALIGEGEGRGPLSPKMAEAAAIPHRLFECHEDLRKFFDPSGTITEATSPSTRKRLGVLTGFWYSLLHLHDQYNLLKTDQPGFAEASELAGILEIIRRFPNQNNQEFLDRTIEEVKAKLPDAKRRAVEAEKRKQAAPWKTKSLKPSSSSSQKAPRSFE